MANLGQNIPERSVLVITFTGPEGQERWMGLYKYFKLANPKARIKDIETLADYKKRLKPLNEAANKEKHAQDLIKMQEQYG